MTGKEAVLAACSGSAAELSGVTTEFTRFKTIVGGDVVVVDSIATYTDSQGDTSIVASCDIFDFEGGRVSHIRSYNIELAS